MTDFEQQVAEAIAMFPHSCSCGTGTAGIAADPETGAPWGFLCTCGRDARIAVKVAAAIDAARTQQRPVPGMYVPAGERRRRAALQALRGLA